MRPIDGDVLYDLVEGRYKFSSGIEHRYERDLLDLICSMPTLTQPNEWVSVEERLPDTAGEFLVVYHPCYWDNVSAEICIGIDSFRGKTAWAKRKYQRVTHWMPLPEPPKED